MSLRARARVEGTVQGVGFRPYVYRLARDERLGGWVRNDERGVVLEVEGAPEAVERFLARLPREAPPLAAVEHVDSCTLGCLGEREFLIVESARRGVPTTPVAADSATCDACLAELRDPADRRYRYPFVNCTDCGPRFTIVRGVPYDRRAHDDGGLRDVRGVPRGVRGPARPPLPRRAERLPRVRAAGAAARRAPGARARGAATRSPPRRRALRGGAIVAVKGVGGYHLACRADDEDAVATLRARKRREDRPFALMAADLDAARALVDLDRGRGRAPARPRPADRDRAARPGARASPPRSRPACASSA